MNKKLISGCFAFGLVLTAFGDYSFKEADIIIPEEAPGLIRFAAEELQKHLRLLADSQFAIKTDADTEYAFVLGDCPEARKQELDVDKLPRDGFYIAAVDNRIFILGKDNGYAKAPNLFFTFYDCKNRGTLLGVYHFLEQQGFRWPAPGEQNIYVPAKEAVSCELGVEKHQPIFRDRMGADYWNFIKKYPDSNEYCRNTDEVYLWGLRLKLSGRTVAIDCHTEQFLKLSEIWQDYPERFQLMSNGERNTRYLCWTDPAVEDIWTKAADAFFSGKNPAAAGLPHLKSWRGQNSKEEFFIDPMDYGRENNGRCMCERCEEFRRQRPCPDDTELIWKVIVSVAEKMQQKHPDKYIATLVYPPKHHFPKTVSLPKNIRVRICMPGAKSVAVPNRLNHELQRIAQWSRILGKENVPLWTYQCEIHGRKLPGPPEVYPRLFAQYLQKIRPLAAGVKNEIHALTHTYRNLDVYIQARLLWDPDRDIDDELNEYFKCYYGPAAEPLRQMFERFETNWVKYWKLVTPDDAEVEKVGLARDGIQLRKIAWSQVYTTDEMQAIDKLLTQAEKLAAGSSAHAHRVSLLRPYLFDIMKAERFEVMQMRDLCPTLEAANKDWHEVESIPFVAAGRVNPELRVSTSAKIRSDKDFLHIQVLAEEPSPELSLTDPEKRNGDKNIWRDNVVELFFYNSDTITQLMINDLAYWSSQQVTKKQAEWRQIPDVDVEVQTVASGFLYSVRIPRTLFTDDSVMFNITRSRRIKDDEEECATLSPASKLGNWHNPESYATLLIKNE